MIRITASRLRSELFEILTKVGRGETVTVQRNGEDVAVISPVKKDRWQSRIKTRVTLANPPEEAFAPIDDIWENYK